MDERVDGFLGKIERAQEQVQSLKAEIDRHISEGTGHSLVGYVERNKDTFSKLYSRLAGPATPIRFAILCGEIVHQLRSSLDHLVWQLILLEGKTPPPRAEYPIFKKREEYVAGAPRKIKGMPDEVETLIEQKQPYHWPRPEDHPLWRIHDLNRIDKHRLLLQAHTNAVFDERFLDVWLANGDRPPPYPIPQPNPEVDIGPQPTIKIVLKYGTGSNPIIPELTQLCDYTLNLVNVFLPRFKA